MPTSPDLGPATPEREVQEYNFEIIAEL